LATGALVLGSLVLALAVFNLIVPVHAGQGSTTGVLAPPVATSPSIASSSGGVYRNASIGFSVDVPQQVRVYDKPTPGAMNAFKTLIPTGTSRIGGIVVFCSASWSEADGAPEDAAILWQQRSSFSRTAFGQMKGARILREYALVVKWRLQKVDGPDVTASAARVGQLLALKVSTRTTNLAGNTILTRGLWLFTPSSEYVFYGVTRASDEQTWLPMFDQITSRLAASK
jgi:hypothetical protein